MASGNLIFSTHGAMVGLRMFGSRPLLIEN
jgi:hypothetical protein